MSRIVRLRRVLSLLLAIFSIQLLFSAPAAAQGDPTTPSTPSEPTMWERVNAGVNCPINDLVKCLQTGQIPTLESAVQEARKTVKGYGCWGCSVFNTFGQVMFVQGEQVSRKADSALRPVLAAIASLFALGYLGSAFVSGDASDLLGRWKVFWKLCIVVACASAWMATGSYQNTWNWVYSPLLQIPLAVDDAVAISVPGGEACSPSPIVPPGAPASANAPLRRMGEIVCGGHQVAVEGIAFGLGMFNAPVGGFTQAIVFALAGFIVMITFGWIAVTFPLKLIDVMIRLAVVGIVTPVLVVCAAFKPTRGYTQIAIKNVLYAGCLFAFTGIMFKVGYQFVFSMAQDAAKGFGTQGDGIGRAIVLVGAGVIFSAMVKMAPALAAEFSGFQGSASGVGDAATGAISGTLSSAAAAGGALAGAGVAQQVGKRVAGAAATREEAADRRSDAVVQSVNGLGKGVTGKD